MTRFSISKIEKKDFKFLGMRLTQSDDFTVSISQDTKSIKELPQGVDSFSEEKKRSFLKSLVGQLLYLDLTQPDLAFMISDLCVMILFKDLGRKTLSGQSSTQTSIRAD